jgi:uncharacterized protein DUF6335
MARKPARKAKVQKKKSQGKAKAVKRSAAPKRRSAPVKSRKTAAKARPRPKAKAAKASRTAKSSRTAKARKPSTARRGGTGRESTLDQTPATGRSVRGRTNPMPTKRSTGTAAGAGDTRRAPGLERERKKLREVEESVPGPPSSLNMDRHGSAARSGRAALKHAKNEHTETSPALTGGDVDADWEDAYAVGDEAPGGDNPTPDQDRVDDIGRALGIEYQDNEELKGADKIADRDKHRWELDPASAEDYPEHDED